MLDKAVGIVLLCLILLVVALRLLKWCARFFLDPEIPGQAESDVKLTRTLDHHVLRAAWRFPDGHVYAAGRPGVTHSQLLENLPEPWPKELGWVTADGRFVSKTS